jgi:leucyl-tRNA synthetase
VIQVNGKVRGKWELPANQGEKELLEFIKTQPNISKHLIGPISKVVYVPNKLLSIVCDV